MPDTSMPSQDAIDVLKQLRDRHNVLLAGVPGSGKSLLLAEVAHWFVGTERPGYEPGEAVFLPAEASRAHRVADLNRDGRLDIVVLVEQAAGVFSTESLVYYGPADWRGGLPRRTPLPTVGARDVAVADLDRDDWLDVVVVNHEDDEGSHLIDSYVYYGGPGGFAGAPDATLPTRGGASASLADLDYSGWLDLFVANHFDNDDWSVDSRIYWGGPGGFDRDAFEGLRTRGAFGSLIVAAERDGDWDIVVPQRRHAGGVQDQSAIFEGRGLRFDGAWKRDLSTQGCGPGWGRDPGDTYDRRERYLYRTSVFDAGGPAFAGELAWAGETPDFTHLRLQVRSAATAQELVAAPWRGPGGDVDAVFEVSPAELPEELDGGRLWQVRVELSRERPVHGPVLDSVTLRLGR